MLTPAMRASSTSAPPVIIEKAVSTQVLVPPFLYLLPLLAETTIGLTLFGVIMVGAWPKRVAGTDAAAAAAAVVVWTNWRRFSFFMTPRIWQSRNWVIGKSIVQSADPITRSPDSPITRFLDQTLANTLAAMIIRWA